MTATTAISGAKNIPTSSRYSLKQIEIFWGLLFILPWLIGLLLFTAGPMLASLYLSFTDYNITSPEGPKWIGGQNYAHILNLEIKTAASPDEANKSLSPGYSELIRIGNTVIGATDIFFWKSMKVTLLFAFIALPSSMLVALSLAVIGNLKLPFMRLFRTLFYMPSVVPAVATALIFQQILGRDTGWLNKLLALFRVQGPAWLQEEGFVIPALALIGLWGVGNAMVIYLAGLQSVPTELYEAAKVDGANAVKRFTAITIPMITPVILYNLVIGLIGTFQYFTIAFVLTNGNGNPNYSAYFYNMYLYKTAFAFSNMGYASALAWILLLIVLAITAGVFFTSGKWVFQPNAPRS
jgi:multiple sugar transport system permease protein